MMNLSIPPIRTIEPVQGVAPPAGVVAPPAGVGAPATTSAGGASGSSSHPFGEMFQSAVSEVARFQEQAAQSADRFLRGEGEEIHKVALDAQRAELSFDLFLQARNKVVDAYQEIMRMQL